ncbi:MAG: MarR family transcriptional regulator [Candidatus Aenigmatarchaeota archaeon]
MNITTKHIGLLIIIIALVLLFIIVPLSFKVAEVGMSQCVHAANEACSITGHIPLESYIGIASVIFLAGAGAFLMFKVQRSEKLSKEMLKKIKENEKKLKGDEKSVYEIIAGGGGALFQSEVVEKSGFGKVKVTRILDKLEAKGLIERRRRGMTNMILLKDLKK